MLLLTAMSFFFPHLPFHHHSVTVFCSQWENSTSILGFLPTTPNNDDDDAAKSVFLSLARRILACFRPSASLVYAYSYFFIHLCSAPMTPVKTNSGSPREWPCLCCGGP